MNQVMKSAEFDQGMAFPNMTSAPAIGIDWIPSKFSLVGRLPKFSFAGNRQEELGKQRERILGLLEGADVNRS